MPGARPTRQKRSRLTRERLLWAVQEIVRERGMEGATVRAIAGRAGVSVGTVYRRFPNKWALVQAAGSRFLQGRTRRMTAALRLARQRRAPPDQVVASFVNGALLGIDREARLLDAFLKDSLPERELYDALRAAVERPRRPLGGGGFALEVLLLCLRGEVLDRSVPSARSAARHALGAELSGHVVAALGL